jgi:hypothetical protein
MKDERRNLTGMDRIDRMKYSKQMKDKSTAA